MVVPVVKPKVTDEEQKYRDTKYPDVKEIKNKNVLCTSCGASVKELVAKGRAICHPYLETLLCEKCHSFYGDGNFSVDEDGSDKYCRWCGQGGTLFLCSRCSSGFCKKCVKRNVSRSALADIEKDDWACYCCNAEPVYELRAQCWAAMQYALEFTKTNKSSSKSKKSKRSNESSDENEEPAQKKKKAKIKDSRSDDEEKSSKDNDLQKSKKKRKEESKKNERKTSENGDNAEGESKRSLRERKSKNKDDDDDEVLPGSEISKGNLKSVISKFNDVVTDCARMTKEVHKKMLECKAKKINFTHINSLESVSDLREKLNSMLVAMEDSSRKIRTALDDYCREWVNTVNEEKKPKGEEKPDDSSEKDAVENGISNDTPEKMDTDESKKPNGNEEESRSKEDEEQKDKNAEESTDGKKEEESIEGIDESKNGNKEDEPDSSGGKAEVEVEKQTESIEGATIEKEAKDTPASEEITSSTSEEKEKSES